MKTSFLMLGTAAVAVRVVIVQAAPVLIKTAPQPSLDGLPPVADDALHPRHQDRLESRTVLTALEKTTNDFANRINSPATFGRGPSLQSKLATEVADKMGEPMGLPKTPKVYGWSKEEMEPFRATPYSTSAHQVHAPSEASAGSLEAQISHELSLAPERQLSFRDSASQPSSPAHMNLDQGKQDASLVPPSPKQPSFKKSASPLSSPVHKDEVEKEHSLDSHLLTGLAHGEHGETSSGAGVYTFRYGKRVHHEDKGLFRHVFTQKEEQEIEELRMGLRNLQAAELEREEKMPNRKKWWWTRGAKDAKLAEGKYREASYQYSVISHDKSNRQQEEAMDREALAKHLQVGNRRVNEDYLIFTQLRSRASTFNSKLSDRQQKKAKGREQNRLLWENELPKEQRHSPA